MTAVTISKMTEEDLPAVHELEQKIFPIPWSFDSLKEEFHNLLASFFVAKKETTVVGFIGMWFVMDECHIANVAVSPEYQRQGIGTQLVNELFQHCQEHGTRYVMLEVRVSNLPAQKLYEKFGFQEEVIRKHYYKNPDGTYEDAIVMSLEFEN